jgi:hypothetical protein
VVTPRSLPRRLARLLRGAAQAVAVAGAVVAIRLVLGVWPAAVVLAALGLGHLLVLWAKVEATAFDRDRRAVVAHSGAARAADHVAFARALAAVAQAYLAECEREARP